MASPRRRPPPEPPHRAPDPPYAARPDPAPKRNSATPPKSNSVTPPRVGSVTSSPKRTLSREADSPRADAVSPPKRIASPAAAPESALPPPEKTVSPPVKPTRADSKPEESAAAAALRSERRDQAGRDSPFRAEKLSLVAVEADGPNESADPPPLEPAAGTRDVPPRGDETNGVGDKIKIFEKAAEDAATAGRQSRPGSMRRARAERLPSDELPPPPAEAEPPPERAAARRARSDGDAADLERPREPQRIVRPEFRPLASPAEVTIRSPSLGAKAPERFPSHGTAFRNVSAAGPAARDAAEDAPDAADALKAGKARARERPTASRGSSYFTRGSEEIWLVKKKDIEEIEERVLDSFRRAGARGGRRPYARSESLEPARGAAAPGAHTLKRQASVACTCGHDKKSRARLAAGAGVEAAPRARSRSHPDAGEGAVLDKYETLV